MSGIVNNNKGIVGNNVLTYLKGATTGAADKLISHITSLGEIASTSDEKEVSTIDTPTKEYIPGQRDCGECEIEMLLNASQKSNVTTLHALHKSGEVRDWVVYYKEIGMYITVSGFIKKFGTGQITPDDLLKVKMTLRLTGDATYTDGDYSATTGS